MAALQDKTAEIQSFENLFLDQSDLDVARVSTQLAHLIQALEIVDNRMKIVPGTKALHRLLPDLVVPMDREYTQQFFGWHNPQFQNYPERRFAEAFASFVAVAQITNPVQYLKSGWYSSRTKVIDNAVVGLCCGLKLQWDPTASFGSIDPLNDTPPRSRFAGKIGTRHFLFGGFSPGNHHEFSGTTIWRCSRRSATSFARTRSISCSKQHG